jgi:hypothetical protein
MVRTNTEAMARYQSVPGEPFIQTLEEVDGRYLALFEQHLNAHRYYSDLLSSFRIELNAFKGEERLDDWKIPNVNFVYINKLAPLGKDKWARALDHLWRQTFTPSGGGTAGDISRPGDQNTRALKEIILQSLKCKEHTWEVIGSVH